MRGFGINAFTSMNGGKNYQGRRALFNEGARGQKIQQQSCCIHTQQKPELNSPYVPTKKLALICWLVGRFEGGFIVIIDESSSSPTAARRLVAQRIKYTETRNDRAQAIIFAAFPGDPP